MGWTFRKSIRFGLLRLNLSKSGIGVSAGVKGIRAGIDAKGRSYVAAGRGALSFRSYGPRGPATVSPVPPSRAFTVAMRVIMWGLVVVLGGCTAFVALLQWVTR